MNAYSLILLYNALIAPHLDYCSTIIYLMNITQIEQLQKIQNKCMRLILNEDWYANINYMLNCLEWLSVDQRIKLNALSFINKIENNLTPQYMKDFLIKRKELHNYNLRRKSDYHLPNYRKSFSQNSLFYKGIQMYNDFKEKTKNKFMYKTNNLRKIALFM